MHFSVFFLSEDSPVEVFPGYWDFPTNLWLPQGYRVLSHVWRSEMLCLAFRKRAKSRKISQKKLQTVLK